jgi:hypothetical protein
MTTIHDLSASATASQLTATRPRNTHGHGAHFVMSEGNAASGASGNAGAVQSFASILAGITGVATGKGHGTAKNLLG